VRFHHNPGGDDSKAKPGEIRLSRVLGAANQYVNSIGVSILPIPSPRESDATLIESLGLEPERLERALCEFKAEFDTMSQFFR
jgi:hypothetical protein